MNLKKEKENMKTIEAAKKETKDPPKPNNFAQRQELQQQSNLPDDIKEKIKQLNLR